MPSEFFYQKKLIRPFLWQIQMSCHSCDKNYVALVSCYYNAMIFFDVVELIHDISLIVDLILDHLRRIIAQDGLSHFTNHLSPKSSDL